MNQDNKSLFISFKNIFFNWAMMTESCQEAQTALEELDFHKDTVVLLSEEDNFFSEYMVIELDVH